MSPCDESSADVAAFQSLPDFACETVDDDPPERRKCCHTDARDFLDGNDISSWTRLK
jgi:hypothetical protein